MTFVALQLGEPKSGSIAVESGLTPGQTVVIAPPPTLNSGDRIRIDSK